MLAKKYRQYVAGEDLDSLLRQFVRREDEKLFEQRVKLTKHIVTAISKNLMDVFFKVPRSNSARRILTYDGDDEGRLKELNGILAKFWGVEGFDDYMATRYIELNHIDPNAFVVFEFKPFDNEKELVQPYPFEVYSGNAVDYKYENRVLEYLIVKGSVTLRKRNPQTPQQSIVPKLDKTATGSKYTLYTKTQTIQIREVLNEQVPAMGTDVEGVVVKTADGSFVKLGAKYFQYEAYLPHNCGKVNAFRVGYVRDLITNGNIMVSPIHAAEPYLEKTIKTNSELDLVASLMAFPQQIKYGDECVAEGCFNGYVDDNPCKACGGSGVKATAPSAQDAIVLKRPESKDELIPLDDIVKYISPPVDVIKWQEEYIEKLTQKAKQIVFNSGIFDKAEIAETATGKSIDLQNVYDTLYPLALSFSRNWENGVNIIAKLADREDKLIAKYTFGKDFKLKTLNDLVVDLEQANKSGADDALISSISNDIAQVVFAEQPIELIKYNVKQGYNPFSGKSEKEIIVLLNSPLIPKRSKVLYANYGLIFDELEAEYAEGGNDFYKLNRSKQKAAIMKKVDEIISDVDVENAPPVLPV